ncbi:MAG: response regulator [Proteobacteria bacterium]|nr:response regulator [Pseudomonadota bacterium]
MNDEHSSKPNKKIHPVLGRSRWVRVFAYALGSLLAVSSLPPEMQWVIPLVLFFGFIYPTLFYQLASRMTNTRLIGFIAYPIDSLLWSLAIIATHYSIVMLLVGSSLAIITSILMLGVRRGLVSMAVMAIVLLAGLQFVEVELTERFFFAQGIYGWLLTTGFMLYVALLVNSTTRNFISARHLLQDKNKQIMVQAEQLASISEVAQMVNFTLDIDQIMKTIMERLNRVFDFTVMAIMFLDKERETLYLDRLRGDVPAALRGYLQGLHIPLSEKESAFTIAVASKAPVYLADVSRDQGAAEGVSAEIYQHMPAKSLITFPLIQDDEVVGVLTFANTKKHFTLQDEDIDHIGRYVTYIVSALRNASDFREIQEARAAADNANKAKSQFLANMSHELRTPMNAVIGYSEMLEEEAQDRGLDDLIPDLQKIRSASHQLLDLINDVLDLSKIEADKVELYPELCNTDDLLADIEATALPLFANNNNRFELEKINQLGEIFLDQTRLSQIILNLLSNAAKFTSEGLVRLTAERCMLGKTDCLVVKVTDSGIGMTPEQLERIFDPFSQADASITREFGGTGLGLSISSKLCAMMGGTLTAQSRKDVGSTFTITIPVEGGEHQERQRSIDTVMTDDKAGQHESDHCILVIDDDEHIRDLMHRMLTREGYRVITAAGGAEGIELARQFRPSVITLDVLMPDQDGWSVLGQLKSDPELMDIPVVMQTILDESRKGFMLGASEFLTKPIDRAHLIDVIRRLDQPADRTALVVEDDEATRSLNADCLQTEGWKVRTAKNGLEGLKACEQNTPGLIILDLMMPEMDGFEFLDQLRQQHPAVEPTVIVVTSKDLTAADLERLNHGVQRIIQKGDHASEGILKEIKRHLGACRT